MATDYAPVLQQVMAQFMKRLRSKALASRVFSRDLDPAASEIGDTINVTIPTVYAASAVSPGATPQAGVDSTPSKSSMTLNEWWEVPISITDKQLGEIQRGVFDAELDSAAVGLVEKINSDIYREARAFYNVAGTGGTNPFATNEDPLLEAIRLLDESKAPTSDRIGILTPLAKSKALKIDAMTRYDARGEGAAKITGVLGNAYGVDLMMDQLVYSHTSTALSAGAATANGVQAINAGSTDGGRSGTISIAKATGTSPLVKGDVFTIAGDSQAYVVNTSVTLAIGNTTVSISPALVKATAGGEAITLVASHKAMPVAHKAAISFASRPVASVDGAGNIFRMLDRETGLALTVELQRQHYQTRLAFSCLYGVKSFRPELGVRLLG